MLSYSSTLILGIIAERPINPYEIKKLLEKISIKKWMPIAVSSLYATIRTLSERGLIDCETAKEGNMPEKKMYTINKKGMSNLQDALRGFLGSVELDKKKTHISSLMICHLEQEEALEILRKKIKKLENTEAMLSRVNKSFEENNAIPYNGLFVIGHELKLIQIELLSTRELAANVDTDTLWNHYVTSIL